MPQPIALTDGQAPLRLWIRGSGVQNPSGNANIFKDIDDLYTVSALEGLERYQAFRSSPELDDSGPAVPHARSGAENNS